MSRDQRRRVAPVAQLLCTIVKERPGIHFRGLARAANVASTGQLRHHIDSLGRRGALIEVQEGRFKRFFVPSDYDERTRQGLARFARRVPRTIGRLLLQGSMNRTELRRHLGCADSTLGNNLTRMVRMGDLIRTPGPTCCLYRLADPTFVREVLGRQSLTRQPSQPPAGPPRPSTDNPSRAVKRSPDLDVDGPGRTAGPLDPPQPPQPAQPFEPAPPVGVPATDRCQAT